jgi:hypothetical protein
MALLLGLGALVIGCDPPSCPDEETLELKVSGNCAAGPTNAELTSSMCGVRLTFSDPTLLLPTSGQVDQARDPLRQGGWQIYGGVCAGGQSCAAVQFRRCIATRIASRLVLDCIDGNGAPVCQADLTE